MGILITRRCSKMFSHRRDHCNQIEWISIAIVITTTTIKKMGLMNLSTKWHNQGMLNLLEKLYHRKNQYSKSSNSNSITMSKKSQLALINTTYQKGRM